MQPEFQPWPKIARLNRDIVITEKLDGTNAAIGIIPCDMPGCLGVASDCRAIVYAQSRTRLITPEADNFGFAAWVRDNAETLVMDLGPGLHFGEWWGRGIQRNYGLDERRFSLFNTKRFGPQLDHEPFATPSLGVVPVLYEGPYGEHFPVAGVLMDLRYKGSAAAPGFMKPEGIVVWHTAARTMFKVTLEGDEAPKGVNA